MPETTPRAGPLRIFLSYASEDRLDVRELYQRLRTDGFDPWLDAENILPGQDWEHEIEKAVRASDVVIVCLSTRFLRAGYIQKEVKRALDVADEQLEGTIFLIPLKLEECEVPDRLSRWQWVNLFEEDGYEKLGRALRARQAALGPPPQSKGTDKPLSPNQKPAVTVSVPRGLVGPSPSRRSSPKPRTGPATEPLSGQAYAIIALVGLIFGVGLLVFYVYEVPRLAQNSAQSQVYYLLLIPWALSCAAFLFGAMRSYARFTHKQVGNVLELGGPVVLFCLVIVGGYKLVPQASPTFDLTVRPYSKGGEAIVASGKITIDLDTDRRTESIDSAGEANFKGIPSRFQGATLKILPQVDGYAEEWQRHKLRGNVLDLPLAKAAQAVVMLTGSIYPPPAKGKKVMILVAGQDTVGFRDEFGRFRMRVNGKDGDRVRLEVYVDGQLLYDDYQVLPGPVTLKLHLPTETLRPLHTRPMPKR